MALSVSKVVRTAAAIALGASAAVGWHVCVAGEPSPAPAAALTNLPVVARPPAEQPPTGLPSDTHLDKTPPRQTVGLDLVRNGWTYNCMECHKLFPAKWHYDRPLNEHKDIQLEHGNNRFCLNCHHPTNRNAFVDYDGAEIAAGGRGAALRQVSRDDLPRLAGGRARPGQRLLERAAGRQDQAALHPMPRPAQPEVQGDEAAAAAAVPAARPPIRRRATPTARSRPAATNRP